MKNQVDELISYIRWMRLIYGEEYYLEGELTEVRDRQALPSAPVTRASRSPQLQDALTQLGPDLRSFYEEIKDCQNCSLGRTRKHFVFGMGNPQADVVFVGEAPGRDEDDKGLPFVGRAGQLLDKMLAAIQLKREEIFIANVLKCRPPNNRDPLPEEVVQCEPYLKKQLDMIRPKVLVALGRVSAQVLLKQYESLSSLRRTVQSYEGRPLIVTYHPAALLRNPQWKRNAWEDLKKLSKLLNSNT